MRVMIAGAVAALLAATPAHAANLLVNGSFEGESNGYDLLGGGSSAISGWKTTNEGVEWFKSATYDPANCCGPAHDGLSVIDLAWYVSNGTPGGGIAQSFGTTAGASYRVSFWGINSTYAGRDGTGTVEAYIDAVLASTASLVRLSPTWTGGDWTQYGFTFVANGASTMLEFRNTQNAYQHFAVIDDVSVTASVPEPAAWALMLAGFGLVGGAMRRRQSVRVTYA